MKAYLCLFVCIGLLTSGCGQKDKKINEVGVTIIPECKGIPKYIPLAGFVGGKPFGFSVAEKGVTGLSLVQFPGNGVSYKLFRFPSWSAAGHLGAVVTRPFINTLKNDPQKQNIIYKVDSQTGNMTAAIELPSQRPVHTGNPYGLLGLAFDCENEILYASSVAGSDVDNETGSIYLIQMGERPEVIATLTGIDAMGLGICYLNGKKNLFIGKARTSDVYSIELNSDGSFNGQLTKVLSLTSLGDRGDDKPRKIRFDPRGNMNVSGISFNFNLANSADKQENIYTFRYDPANSQWSLINIRKGIL
jgi:hypothetical protein